jgi:hypothetical protein
MEQEWPTVIKIANLSMEELWGTGAINSRFEDVDDIILVLSIDTLDSFNQFIGVQATEGFVDMNAVASPQLQRVMVATYSDPVPGTWAITEPHVRSFAESSRYMFALMSKTDGKRARETLEEAAEMVIAWRVEDSRRRKEENGSHEEEEQKRLQVKKAKARKAANSMYFYLNFQRYFIESCHISWCFARCYIIRQTATLKR